jgi:RNA polymerase sigma-70 factor (ECF subfamily)
MLRTFARHRGAGAIEADGAVSAAPTPEAAFERWRVAELVHEAIERLAPEYRQVLVLRDIEGLPGAEVCRSLGLSEAAMKSRLLRARSTVRAQLLRFEEVAGRPDAP